MPRNIWLRSPWECSSLEVCLEGEICGSLLRLRSYSGFRFGYWATSQVLGLPSARLGTMAPPSRNVPPFMLFGGQPPPHEAGQNSPFHMGPRECCFPTEEGSPPTYFSTGNVCHTPSSTCCIMTYFPKKELTLLASEVPFRKPSHVEECISIFSNM